MRTETVVEHTSEFKTSKCIHSFITEIYTAPLQGRATQRRFQPQHDQIEPP